MTTSLNGLTLSAIQEKVQPGALLEGHGDLWEVIGWAGIMVRLRPDRDSKEGVYSFAQLMRDFTVVREAPVPPDKIPA